MNVDLLVIYTDQLEACRAFYAGIGLIFDTEQHGRGPAHYAALLSDGTVLELYPAGGKGSTGRLRLGLTNTSAATGYPVGQHLLTDPDGRPIVLTIREE